MRQRRRASRHNMRRNVWDYRIGEPRRRNRPLNRLRKLRDLRRFNRFGNFYGRRDKGHKRVYGRKPSINNISKRNIRKFSVRRIYNRANLTDHCINIGRTLFSKRLFRIKRSDTKIYAQKIKQITSYIHHTPPRVTVKEIALSHELVNNTLL